MPPLSPGPGPARRGSRRPAGSRRRSARRGASRQRGHTGLSQPGAGGNHAFPSQHLQPGNGHRSRIALQNTDVQTATVTLNYYTDRRQPGDHRQVTLPPRGMTADPRPGRDAAARRLLRQRAGAKHHAAGRRDRRSSTRRPGSRRPSPAPTPIVNTEYLPEPAERRHATRIDLCGERARCAGARCRSAYYDRRGHASAAGGQRHLHPGRARHERVAHDRPPAGRRQLQRGPHQATRRCSRRSGSGRVRAHARPLAGRDSGAEFSISRSPDKAAGRVE